MNKNFGPIFHSYPGPSKATFPETNMVTENQWLENDISYWEGLFFFRGYDGIC